jgi:protein-disulfide isomerase
MNARIHAAALSLCLVACDAPTREEVAGLQQRIDALATENAALRETTKAMGEQVEAAKATAAQAQAASTSAKGDAGKVAADLQLLTTRVTALETKPTGKPTPAGRPDPALRYRVDIGDAQIEGAKDAKVTIVIFSDFQCPFCARVQATLDELQKEYGSDVRIVAKHNPLAFHPNAEHSARAAEAAGKQGKFWEMHDKLYADTKALGISDIEGYAKDLGLDVARFKKDMDSSEVADRIEANKKQARELGAAGTPSFFINGRFLSGAQPKESFKVLIDAELANADGLIAGGTPRASVYDELMKTALVGPGFGK